MSDLIVDATLDDTNRDLKKIKDEFDKAKDRATENDRIWGQADLRAAMSEFANNWYVHREKITKRLGDLSVKVDQACAAWTDAEKQLSESLQVEGTTHG